MDRPRARRRRGAGEGWRRVKDYLRQFVSFMFSNVGIVGLVVSYAIAGAFIFQAIEGGAAGATGTGAATVTTARGRVVRELWGATSRVLSEADWRDLAAAEVAKLQQAVVDAAHNNGLDASPPPRRLALDDEEDRADGGAGDEEEEVAASSQWSFSGSFLYSLTVITTIGYGNVAPQTKWGKLATILYAIAGMPLFLLYLSNIGDILAKSFKWTYAQCCLCRWCNSSTSSTPRVKKTRRRSHRRRRRHRSSRRRTSRASLRRRASVWSHEVAAARGGTAMAAGGGSGAVWPGADSWPPEEDMMDGDGGDTEDDDDDSEDDSEDDSSDDDDDSEEDEEDTDGLEVVDGAGPAAAFGGAAPGVGSAVGPGFGSRVGSGVGSGGVAGGGGGSSRSGGAAAAAESVTVPVTLCLAIMVGYVCGGAMLFAKWEDWDFLDGSYFCFISLSTIGFGDIVPGDRITSGNGVELSFIFCSAYLMLGMALIAMCFSLMQEEVVHKMRGLMRAVKAMGRCLCGRRRGGDDPGGGVGAGGGRGAAAGDIPLEQRMAMR